MAMTSVAWGQRMTSFGNITPKSALAPVASLHPVTPPCSKSGEPFDIDDYDGPFNRLVARVSQKVDRVTAHEPSHKSSELKPCSLSGGAKFRLWVKDATDPLNFVGATFGAGIDQAENGDPQFGQGGAGYGKRFLAEVADNTTSGFFGIFLYPTIFHQDPRYYRIGRGSTGGRLGHALEHRFVTTSDSGKRVINYSEWFSVISTNLVGNLYHPGDRRGFGPMVPRVGSSIGNDMGWDVLREFWPEIAHKFKLPFRTHEEDPSATPATAVHSAYLSTSF